MTRLNKEIGLRLKVARKAANFKTALDFANKLHIPKSTYSQHENGKRGLTAEQIIYYAQCLDVEANWLLTGLGHPCPNGKHKQHRKEKIHAEIIALQQAKALPTLKKAQITLDDHAAVVNMELLGKILISAMTALTTHNLKTDAQALIDFCVDVYNNIEFLLPDSGEKNKIIELSINSMLKGKNMLAAVRSKTMQHSF